MKNKRGVSGKAFALLLAVVLALGCAIGGTVAWLIDDTESVVNTFTYGDINIDLTETDEDHQFDILPGNDVAKDPKVTVEVGSEDCWLFVEIEETNWPTFQEADGTLKVRYDVADGWTELKTLADGSIVYWRQAAAGQEFSVLANNTVYVSENLTKIELDSIKTDGVLPKPTLTFTAYAVQRDDNIDSAEIAWEKVETDQTANQTP